MNIRKLMLPEFQAILVGLGITKTDGTRLDANETGFIAKQLEYVMAQTYDVEYGPNLAETFIPIDTSIPEGAESFSYDQWDHLGLAKIITSWSDDLPKVEAFVKRYTQQCKSLGASYEITVQDIRAVQFSRGRLNDERAKMARTVIDNLIDQLAATGNSDHGLKGFTNHSAVPSPTLPHGHWTASTATADILEDLNYLQGSIVSATRTLRKPNFALFSTVDWSILQRPVGANLDRTILKVFLENSPYIKSADQWPTLDTAGDDGKSRIIMYQRVPEVVSFAISIRFLQHPPQQKNLAIMVPCEARVGGVTTKYPFGMAYGDTASVAV